MEFGETKITLNDMSKETIKRDKNGRFMKKENKKAFDYEVVYKQQKETIAILTKERDFYKMSLGAYEACLPKLKEIEQYHRRQSNKLHDVNVILLDALRAAAAEMNWLQDRIPFWRKLFLREEMHEWDEYFESLCRKAEGLDRE